MAGEIKNFTDLIAWQKAHALLETQSQLLVAKDLGYLKDVSYEIFEPKIIEVAKLLSGLKNYCA